MSTRMNLRPFTLSRRAMLRGALGAGVGLPVLEAMLGRPAFAQAAPRRFVFAYCGIPPVGEEVDRATGRPPQFVLPDAAGPFTAPFKVGLAPLEALGLAGDTAVISDLRIPRTGSDNGRRYGSSGFHYETMGPIVSGVSQLTSQFSRYALGPSCDWLLAQKIGAATRLPSLVYLVQAGEHTTGYAVDHISFKPRQNRNPQYDPPTLRNDPIVSPRAAFDQLFEGFTAPMAGQPAPAPDATLVRRQDVLARVRGAYTRLRERLGAADRQRLDQHMENVHTLEQRIAAAATPPTPAPGPARCVVPARPGVDPAASGGYADEDARAASFVDLVHLAFACDLSRVVSLELTSSMSGLVLPTSMGITYRNWDGSPLPAPPLHEATHGRGNNLSVAECIRWHVKHLAALAKKLKDTPDVGGTMLDNTVIVLAFEAGIGNTRLEGGAVTGERPPHTSEGMAALVIGGKALGLQLGRHIVASGQHPAAVSLTAMRAVGGADIAALGEIRSEIPGLRT